jgi:Tetratricopeptide repeat
LGEDALPEPVGFVLDGGDQVIDVDGFVRDDLVQPVEQARIAAGGLDGPVFDCRRRGDGLGTQVGEVRHLLGLLYVRQRLQRLYPDRRPGRRRELRALEHYGRALPILREVGDRAGEAVTRYNVAMIHRAQGELGRAVAELEQVVELDRQVGHPDLQSDTEMLHRVRQELASSDPGRGSR